MFFILSFLVALNALIIEEVKVCHPVCERLTRDNCETICSKQSIELPEKLINCVRQLPFKYNNGKNIAFFTTEGQIIKTSSFIDCEANKKNFHFSYDGKKFDVTFNKRDVTVDVTLPNGEVISNSFNIYSLLNMSQKFVREHHISIIIIITILIICLVLIIVLSCCFPCFRLKFVNCSKFFLNIPIKAIRFILEGSLKRKVADKSADKSTDKQAEQSSNNPTAPALPISITECNETIDQAVQKYVPRVSFEQPSNSYFPPAQYLPPREQAIQYEAVLSKTKTKLSGRDYKNKNKDDIKCVVCQRYFAPCAIANHRNSHK
jgi:hypothetical protein